MSVVNVDLDLFPKIDRGSDKNVVFFGCVNCQYSRQVYELVKDVAAAKNANFIFAHYPIKTETTYLTGLLDCAYSLDQEKYWQFLSRLFAQETAHNVDQESIIAEAADFGFNHEELMVCLDLPATATRAAQLQVEMDKTNLYCTPVVFIEETVLIGPKPRRVYERALSNFSLF